MIRIASLLQATVFPLLLLGQGQRRMEVQLSAQYDLHADYSTRFFNSSYTNPTQLYGWSYGLRGGYHHPLRRHLHAVAGLGLYRLGVDKVRQGTPFGMTATARDIAYRHPSGILPGFATKRYHYTGLAIEAGLDWQGRLGRHTALSLAAAYGYLFTVAQCYRITYDQTRYRTGRGRTLGFQASARLGIVSKFGNGKHCLHPALLVPVYQQLKGDPAFGEDRGMKMTKWGNGLGISLAYGRYF